MTGYLKWLGSALRADPNHFPHRHPGLEPGSRNARHAFNRTAMSFAGWLSFPPCPSFEVQKPAKRFLAHEHADVTTALKEHGIDPVAVLFVKRRGRMHVQVTGRPDAFIFFRKKSTRIDEAHAWEHRTDYFVGPKNDRPCDWSGVMAAFRKWLA